MFFRIYVALSFCTIISQSADGFRVQNKSSPVHLHGDINIQPRSVKTNSLLNEKSLKNGSVQQNQDENKQRIDPSPISNHQFMRKLIKMFSNRVPSVVIKNSEMGPVFYSHMPGILRRNKRDLDLNQNMSQYGTLEKRYEMRQPDQVDPTHNLSRPDPTRNLSHPVRPDRTHNLRRARCLVRRDPTYNSRHPVKRDPTHNLRRPVKRDPIHNLKRLVPKDPTRKLRRPVQRNPSRNLRRLYQLVPTINLRCPFQPPTLTLRRLVRPDTTLNDSTL